MKYRILEETRQDGKKQYTVHSEYVFFPDGVSIWSDISKKVSLKEAQKIKQALEDKNIVSTRVVE